MHCKHCGNPLLPGAAVCLQCGFGAGQGVGYCAQCGAVVRPGEDICPRCGAPGQGYPAGALEMAARIAGQARLAGILWIVVGALQILGCVTLIAGGWNLAIGVRQLTFVSRICPGNPEVPARFERELGLLIAGILINLLLGGVLPALLCLLDLYIRDQVLARRSFFEQPGALQ